MAKRKAPQKSPRIPELEQRQLLAATPAATPADANQVQVLARKYKRNFLVQVIARIDFGAPIPISPSGPPAKVIALLKKQFPIPEPRKVTERTIALGDSGASEVSHEKQEWLYHGKDREKTCHIADECMLIEYKKYHSYDQLRSEFLAIVNALFDAFDNLQVKRLGLRYIDKIEVDEKDPTDWSTYLSPNLLGSFNLADDRKTIARVFNVIEFNYGDYNLRFQYGMLNPDYPAPIRKKVFTLDWDAYCTLLLSKEEIAQNLERFRTKLKVAFEEVITDGARKKMGVLRG
jgi:uncharacterized protein (TIGR04255 family)